MYANMYMSSQALYMDKMKMVVEYDNKKFTRYGDAWYEHTGENGINRIRTPMSLSNKLDDITGYTEPVIVKKEVEKKKPAEKKERVTKVKPKKNNLLNKGFKLSRKGLIKK